MARKAHVKVIGRFDMASRTQEGTLTIDMGSRTIRVRPLRRRKVYELPLDSVAEWIVRRVIMAELAAKRAEKRAKRRMFAR